jgi:hypothetical protein
MNKRGQFYIIAALIIVLAISGLTAVSSYTLVKPDPKVLESISSDLKLEGPKIFDSGIFSNSDPSSLFEGFIKNEFAPYFLQKTENADIVFIYGNITDLYGLKYKNEFTGTLTITIGSQAEWYQTSPFLEKMNIRIYPGDDFLKVTLLNRTFQFKLRDNEMFYFVIGQEKEGEFYVEKNQ